MSYFQNWLHPFYTDEILLLFSWLGFTPYNLPVFFACLLLFGHKDNKSRFAQQQQQNRHKHSKNGTNF